MEANKRKSFQPGTAWIRNGYRCIYEIREIKRGKNKGKIEATYRKGLKYRKIKLNKMDIVKYPF